MARAAAGIAAGDLSQRVKATSRDEIGVLAMSFNHMAASLDATYRDLAQLNIGLEEKVQERTEELRRQQAQLQEPLDHALGRSRGGFTTKVHLVCDKHGPSWPSTSRLVRPNRGWIF